MGDDPETPGDDHWEINLAVMLSRGGSQMEWALPDVDLNYGRGDRIQLKFDTPFALTQDHGVRSGLGPSLLGVKWRFLGDSQSGFAMSIYPQWTSHLVRSSVDRGLADAGGEWFLPIETAIKLGDTSVDLEVGRRFQGDASRTWEAGVIAGRNCAREGVSVCPSSLETTS